MSINVINVFVCSCKALRVVLCLNCAIQINLPCLLPVIRTLLHSLVWVTFLWYRFWYIFCRSYYLPLVSSPRLNLPFLSNLPFKWVTTPVPMPWPSCAECSWLPWTASSWTDTSTSLWIQVSWLAFFKSKCGIKLSIWLNVGLYVALSSKQNG